MDAIYKSLLNYGLSEAASKNLYYFIVMLVIVVTSVTVTLIINKIIMRFLTKRIENNKYQWDDVLLSNKVFQKISMIIPGIVMYNGAVFFDDRAALISKISIIYILLIIIITSKALINSADDIYRQFPVSKDRPIKGLLQVIEIVLYVIFGITIVSIMIDKNPIALISGIGALTAIITLVFKDSIVGFIAGIQLTWNDMLRIDDWIEMPKYGANGEVIEISLTTVKVRNFDKTITTIPTYALVSDSFINWRGMQETGARRIKRAINIDLTSIKFCNEEMLEKYKKVNFLKSYIEEKEAELEAYNERVENTDILVNGRNLTNVGIFRIYAQNYINNHPRIHADMTRMVRQLAPTENGLPLEVYVFVNDTTWTVYESAQSDIFDHLLAVAEFFDLRIFQSPSSFDYNKLIRS
ncbi:mechanosensitive ion channel domain-containing protein [Sedimentibacter sp.]|uniref:mechanosensitive ion channel family protein n=1 Tax=Sedimentibacter sp. TaxID=1960295 RepID=UPI00289AA323|nr:mechanosensitive ion channel domain-containing protein [Sedimentibacter sp.]